MSSRHMSLLLVVASPLSLAWNYWLIILIPLKCVVKAQNADLSCDAFEDFCPTSNNRICESELGSVQVPGCERGDCSDCRHLCSRLSFDCESCLTNGCYFCPGDGTCFNSDLYRFTPQQSSCLNQSNYLHISTSGNTCTKPENFFSDPLYSAQQWVFDLIDVQPVWSRGLSGAGIRLRINDDGLDVDHGEFLGRFDKNGSCDDGLYLLKGNHGTSVASIAAASANNGLCSVGISPNVTLSACDVFNSTSRSGRLDEKLEHMDISQNSWGVSGCAISTDLRSLDRKLQQVTCPFSRSNVFENDPCDVCNFTSSLGTSEQCQEAIISHCRRNFRSDSVACIEFLDLLVEGGECEYNTLPPAHREALSRGVTEGRDGKGVIFLVAAGNDLSAGADTNFEGLSNTRLTISVGAVGKDGLHTSYSTPGASLFVTAPGGDSSALSNHVTAQPGNGCQNAGEGTSFSCPVVAAVVALVLEANYNLTWRDVQGVLALTSHSVPNDPNDKSLVTNGAGYSHSNFYGFGIVNANDAVIAAESWTSFSEEELLIGESGLIDIPIVDESSASVISTLTIASTGEELDFFTESVVILLDIRHFSRGDLDVVLTSPSGTLSVLHPGRRPESTQLGKDERWKLMTVRAWGEQPWGNWTLNVTDISPGDLHDCVELWHITTTRGTRVTCDFFESREYCVDGGVNVDKIQSDDIAFVFNLTDEGGNSTFDQACCACGGGRTRADKDFVDRVVQWRLMVYGHYNGSRPLPPSAMPSLLPSRTPSTSPIQATSTSPTNMPTTPTQPPNDSSAGILMETRTSVLTTLLVGFWLCILVVR